MINFKNIFCSVLIVFSINLNAQTNKKSPTFFSTYNLTAVKNYSEKSLPFQTDTIKPASFAMPCYTTNPSNALVQYYADVKTPHDSGYVSGTNIYGDLEKAQHFVNTTSTTLTGCAVLLKCAFSSTSVTIGTKVKLYGYSAGVPTTSVITTSSLTPQNNLTNGLAVFTFSVPIVISTDFVMSVVLPNHIGDTTAIYSTLASCNSGSNSWEKAMDNTWGSIHNNWAFSASQNIDLAIFPLKQGAFVTTSLKTNIIEDLLIYDGVNNILKVKNNTKPIHIAVYDLAGKILIKQILESSQQLDLSVINNGIYLINLTDNVGVTFTKKVVVIQ